MKIAECRFGGGGPPPPLRGTLGEGFREGKVISRKDSWKEISKVYLGRDDFGKTLGKYLLTTPRCPLKRAGGYVIFTKK